ADVEAAVRAIVADVAARGDRALKDYTQKFDDVDLDRIGLKVTSEEIATAARLRRCNWRATASRPITAASCRTTIASPMRSASSSARAGPPSRRSGFM